MNDRTGYIRSATVSDKTNRPFYAGCLDASYLALSLLGINQVDNAVATLRDENSTTDEKVQATDQKQNKLLLKLIKGQEPKWISFKKMMKGNRS